MATLTGKIIDVTARPPDSISSITVKAPSARIGGGTDVIVSSPAEVTFDKTTGDITISGLTGGLSWLYIEGDGWSDSIALVVAEGMITLVEAMANAQGLPGLADYVRLLGELEIRVDDIAQDAVDVAIDTRMDAKADVSSVNDLAAVTTGITGVVRRNSRKIRALVSELATKADKAGVDAALATKADKAGVDAALATKADVSTVDDLATLATTALGVGKRNATRLSRLVESLAGKADTDTVDDLATLATTALGVGKRNATRLSRLVESLAGKADVSTVTSGLATKADTRTLDARVPAGGHSGQLLMATPTGGRWSWADRHPTQYHDIY